MYYKTAIEDILEELLKYWSGIYTSSNLCNKIKKNIKINIKIKKN